MAKRFGRNQRRQLRLRVEHAEAGFEIAKRLLDQERARLFEAEKELREQLGAGTWKMASEVSDSIMIPAAIVKDFEDRTTLRREPGSWYLERTAELIVYEHALQDVQNSILPILEEGSRRYLAYRGIAWQLMEVRPSMGRFTEFSLTLRATASEAVRRTS